jgi:hypothetical protein
MWSQTRAGFVAAGLLGLAVCLLLLSLGSADSAKRPTFPGPLYGVLLGSNEIGSNGQRRAGDEDGKGSASATIDEEALKLCFGLTAKNIDEPIAAHIHRGNRGSNGPVVVTLTAPSAGDPGASSGCVDITQSVARSITKNPHKFYWNIHTEAFPGGAVRGQVFTKTR